VLIGEVFISTTSGFEKATTSSNNNYGLPTVVYEPLLIFDLVEITTMR
jgi:hypothetical protein